MLGSLGMGLDGGGGWNLLRKKADLVKFELGREGSFRAWESFSASEFAREAMEGEASWRLRMSTLLTDDRKDGELLDGWREGEERGRLSQIQKP